VGQIIPVVSFNRGGILVHATKAQTMAGDHLGTMVAFGACGLS